MKNYSRVYAKIDLDAIASNVNEMKKKMKSNTQIMAVIKADGYGHGAVPIAKMLEDKDFIWGVAVATLDEALVLRSEGIKKPILVLGCVFPDQYLEMIRNNIRMNVYTEDMARAISKIAEEEEMTAYMHIKLDTGMGRLGFEPNTANIEAIMRISTLKNVCMEGIFTHFSKADEVDKQFTYNQIELFKWTINELKNNGIDFQFKHCSNSAAIIDVPDAWFDIVRAGISLYGLYPSEEVDKDNLKLIPAMELFSQVVHIKEVPQGTPISYGGTFVSNKTMKIATIPFGYGDGYPRSLSNTGYVLIHDERAPIVGKVCMDQFMVDVTHIENVCFGDRVTLIGRDKENYISVEELSDLSGRFNYEFVCDLGKRIPRLYVRDGKVSEKIDYFV